MHELIQVFKFITANKWCSTVLQSDDTHIYRFSFFP